MTEAAATRSPGRGLLTWVPVLAACTALLWLLRDPLDEAHMALALLLVVLGGSARNGRVVGVVLAVLAFPTFNFFLLPPFYTFTIDHPLNWWILITFLSTGAVAAQLFHRAQSALETAERRARELEPALRHLHRAMSLDAERPEAHNLRVGWARIGGMPESTRSPRMPQIGPATTSGQGAS